MINWVVGGLLAIAAVFAIRYLIRQQRRGECAGGCGGCSGCAHGSQSESDCCGINESDYGRIVSSIKKAEPCLEADSKEKID